jgi:D-alanyl-D-alanine carboxypeptidase
VISVEKKPTVFLLILITALAVGVLCACSAPKKGPAVLMEEYLRAARQFWNYQGSVLVSRDDEVIFETGLGMARLEGNVENTPSTRFLIGSVTKTFTAAAVMQLAENGLLGLDDPLRKYVPEYPEKTGAAITIRHLLSHTSGVPDAVPDPRILGDLTKPVTPLELIGLVRDKGLDFAPGERAAYSNTGYVLLGMVIERVSKQSYYDYLQDHIFGPLDMTSSGYREDWSDAPQFAMGYFEGRDGRLAEAPRIHPSLGFSAGALYSTVLDLLKWDKGLRSDKILSADSKEMMFRAARDNFGYGWLVMETWGRKDLAHGGGAPGFNAWIERWPEEKAFVAVLSNNGGSSVGEIGRSLAAVLFGEEYQAPQACGVLSINPDLLDEYTGAYRIGADSIREVLREGNFLFVTRSGGRKYPILPFAEDRFFFPNDKGATIRFLRDGSGKVAAHVFHQLGLDETATKVR